MRSRRYLYCHFHALWQVVQQLDLYHQADYLSHRAMRNRRRVQDLNVLLVIYRNALVADHSQLLQSQRIFGIIDVPDQFKYLKLIKGII